MHLEPTYHPRCTNNLRPNAVLKSTRNPNLPVPPESSRRRRPKDPLIRFYLEQILALPQSVPHTTPLIHARPRFALLQPFHGPNLRRHHSPLRKQVPTTGHLTLHLYHLLSLLHLHTVTANRNFQPLFLNFNISEPAVRNKAQSTTSPSLFSLQMLRTMRMRT